MSRHPLVLVVDDEESILESVTFSLENEGYRTVVASDGGQALRQLQEVRPDLIILDVMLPDCSGIEVCRAIRALGEQPILFLSARDHSDDKVLGLESGADDYLSKPFKFKELLARVKALLRRHVPSNPRLSYGELVLDPVTHTVTHKGQLLRLTLREYELLEFLLRRPQQVFSRDQILRQLWGWQSDAETNLVEVHISALRQKLGDAQRRLIRTVRGVGYALG